MKENLKSDEIIGKNRNTVASGPFVGSSSGHENLAIVNGVAASMG